MKKSIDYLNGLRIKNTKNFENKVLKLLPEGTNEIYLDSCCMERASGRGSYNFVLRIEINKTKVKIKNFTHDSQSFDYWQDLEKGTRNYENWIKNVCLAILDENRERLIEVITED
jgi:hypothetical protein